MSVMSLCRRLVCRFRGHQWLDRRLLKGDYWYSWCWRCCAQRKEKVE